MKPTNEYALCQMELHKMNAMRAHAEIVSGAYKFRTTKRGAPDGQWVDLPDDEKLKATVAEMQRHIQHMWECMEAAFDGSEPR